MDEKLDPQKGTPYASALNAQTKKDTLNLMVPGHGASAEGMSMHLNEFFGTRTLELDIPPLIDGIDVGPDSPLQHSLRLAARAWKVRRTWFLTGGATQANHMAALAIGSLKPRSTVIMQRSAHSSFIDGITLADLVPKFLQPSIDTDRGINHGVTPEQVSAALRSAADLGEEVSAVYIISPSYFGAVSDVRGISVVTHKYDVPLIVDGAWGAHFGFDETLPASPTTEGADIVISSTHKLGGSLTQSAMLHLCEGEYADQLGGLTDRAHMMTQSTSPNALLLASLDIARYSMIAERSQIPASIAKIEAFKNDLRKDGRFSIITDEFSQYPDIVNSDPMRVAIDIRATGVTGHEVRRALAHEFNILLEISTVRAVVAYIGPGKYPDLNRLKEALLVLADRAGARIAYAAERSEFPKLPPNSELRIRPNQALLSASEIVTAEEAIGRVSTDSLAAYPPGIPNVIPGEVITREIIEFLQSVATSPIGYVRGAQNAKVTCFRVVTESNG